MPDFAGSTRRSRLPKEWPALRARILERDGHVCTWLDAGQQCGAPANQVDYIVRGDNHSESNLRALSSWHHARKTGAEGQAARRPASSMYRTPEKHPGLK